MSLISPTTLFVAGSISITLSSAEMVWMMRTVAAPSVRPAQAAIARVRESLVFIATHFKLAGHVADSFSERPRAAGVRPRLRRVQGEGAAAVHRKAARTRRRHRVSCQRHALPPAAAAEGADAAHPKRIA